MGLATSVTRILVVLGVFVFSSPAFSVTPAPETVKAQQSNLGAEEVAVSSASKGKGSSLSFGVGIAGTYLVTRQPDDGPSRILNLFADGNLTSIQSTQFSAGAIGDVKVTWFSNQHGTWKRVGKHEIEATVFDLSFEPTTGKFLGTGIGHYSLQFDNAFQTVKGKVKGEIFSPGVDPLDPDTEPLTGFSDEFQARRATVDN